MQSRRMPVPFSLIFLSGVWLLLGLGCESPQPATVASPKMDRHVKAEQTDRPASNIEQPAAEKPAAKPKVASRVAVAPTAKGAKGAVKKPSVGPPAMPPVLLSEQHQKSCKVSVGDTFPQLELADLSGKNRPLAAEYGKKLTVLCLFSGKMATEEQELADLTPEVISRYGKDGVSVIGVAVGAKADTLADLLKRTGVKFPVFVDPQRTAYQAVATEFLPRTYLIDANGKILWLDLEYSATTRRQLNQAIRHVLETK